MIKKVLFISIIVLCNNLNAASLDEVDTKEAFRIESHWTDIPATIFGVTNTHHASQMLGRKPGFSFDVEGNLKNTYNVIVTHPAAVMCDMGNSLSRGLIVGHLIRAGISSYRAKDGSKLETFKQMLINPEAYLKEGVKYSNFVKVAFSNKTIPTAIVAALVFHGLSYMVDPTLEADNN